MKMKLVPFKEFKASYGNSYGIPGGPESASCVAIDAVWDDRFSSDMANIDDLFAILDAEIARVRALDDDDETYKIHSVIDNRSDIDGFAMVKPEIVEMLDGVRPASHSHESDEGVAQFEVAFCVKHASRIVMVQKEEA